MYFGSQAYYTPKCLIRHFCLKVVKWCIHIKMKYDDNTYYCELVIDNSVEEKTEYRKNISVEKLTTWFEKLNSNFGILFYYPRINRMYFYPVSNEMELSNVADDKKFKQIKIDNMHLLS